MHKNQGPVYYGDYLQLNKFLDTQHPLSRKFADSENPEAHDEMLFIVVHQAFELWFKQINHELDSIVEIFKKPVVEENELSKIVHRLDRIKKIQPLFITQLDILETMTPMDFLEFRNLLIPASGFQSVQFREIEIKMGLSTDDRLSVDREFFLGRLSKDDRAKLNSFETAPSILKLIEAWLERTPYTISENFNFWVEYKKAVDSILDEDEQTVMTNIANLSDQEKKIQLENLRLTKETFKGLFDKDIHKKLLESNQRKLSQKAILNALFIMLYREEPMLTLPHQILTLVMDIDENFTTWRYRHALLAQRMLGTKIGTGGSSGHQYLKRAADNNRVFVDLFNLSTYLIPRTKRPLIPQEILNRLRFESR